MTPGQKQELELKRPGLDFSSFDYKGKINSSLVLDFAKFLKNGNEDWVKLSTDNVLSKLNVKDKNVSGILFGDFLLEWHITIRNLNLQIRMRMPFEL